MFTLATSSVDARCAITTPSKASSAFIVSHVKKKAFDTAILVGWDAFRVRRCLLVVKYRHASFTEVGRTVAYTFISSAIRFTYRDRS